MTTRPCPVCGNDDQSRVFAPSNVDWDRLDSFAFASRKAPEHMHHRLIACPSCDALYSSPIPVENSLLEAYAQASFDSGNEAAYASHTYLRLLRRFIAALPDRRGALDIGTGDGAFLSRLIEAGFTQVQGVEPSAAPIQAAAPAIRSLIRRGAFRGSDFAPGTLALVTCFQTIEHVSDPLALCREALTLLKPGGALLLVCHNRRALSARVMGRKSPIFDVEHLQLLSNTSVCRLLAGAGFTRPVARPIVNTYPLTYWLRLAPLPPGLKGATDRALRAVRLGGVLIPVPAGNLVAVGFRPGAG